MEIDGGKLAIVSKIEILSGNTGYIHFDDWEIQVGDSSSNCVKRYKFGNHPSTVFWECLDGSRLGKSITIKNDKDNYFCEIAVYGRIIPENVMINRFQDILQSAIDTKSNNMITT